MVDKLKWYKDLYIGEDALKDKEQIIWNVDHGTGMFNTYHVTLATNEKNLLEIISTNVLLQKYIRKSCPIIIGIGKGYDEAVGIVVKIIDEMYHETGSFKIKEYLNIK